jgi:hypothetical protein
MRKFKGTSVEGIVNGLEKPTRDLTEKLRAIVKKALPDIVERVKWGNITYLLNGKTLAWIIVYADHVDFGFFRGAELESPKLEGTGKALRHIKIKSAGDVNEAEIKRLLKKAAELENQKQ